jgi:hypothetical protein
LASLGHDPLQNPDLAHQLDGLWAAVSARLVDEAPHATTPDDVLCDDDAPLPTDVWEATGALLDGVAVTGESALWHQRLAQHLATAEAAGLATEALTGLRRLLLQYAERAEAAAPALAPQALATVLVAYPSPAASPLPSAALAWQAASAAFDAPPNESAQALASLAAWPQAVSAWQHCEALHGVLQAYAQRCEQQAPSVWPQQQPHPPEALLPWFPPSATVAPAPVRRLGLAKPWAQRAATLALIVGVGWLVLQPNPSARLPGDTLLSALRSPTSSPQATPQPVTLRDPAITASVRHAPTLQGRPSSDDYLMYVEQHLHPDNDVDVMLDL